MCCIKVLKHILKRRGLRQSLCNTPRRTGMKGVRNSDVIIEVLKSVYRLLIINLILDREPRGVSLAEKVTNFYAYCIGLCT